MRVFSPETLGPSTPLALALASQQQFWVPEVGIGGLRGTRTQEEGSLRCRPPSWTQMAPQGAKAELRRGGREGLPQGLVGRGRGGAVTG